MLFTRLTSACAAAALFLAAVPAMATTPNYTKTNIPFDFVVAGKSMPAGSYIFSKNSVNVLSLRHENGDTALTMSMREVGNPGGPADPKVVFVKKNGKLHLSEVHLNSAAGGSQVAVK